MMNFEALSLPQKQLPQSIAGRYRVYSDAANFVTVEAANAHEALKASGMQKACRIERDTALLSGIVDLDKLCVPAGASAAASAAAKPETAAPPEAAATTTAEAAKSTPEASPSAAS